ncbi:prepilin-type N-terminal cleavage/methylation domain-containing protein [Faucicola boevrei]|uniref:prepilin-type N-terminal cleavage/methylation domain-containing protein n=1 Tax=Faucicola boevrei TaxID=346665 RepID=UPI000360342A|nr:prepilin-type N-terminal cleavage/methylation domain-containing protein [Moraxella boevrei]
MLVDKTYQRGFTLIELMISLVLGLLISAAAVQIYIANVRTSTTQKSGSSIQDTSIFGIQALEKNIRQANLGNEETSITDKTVGGGIVLTKENIGATEDKPEWFTKSGDGFSNTNVGSDQLTIQYRNISGKIWSDCEGSDIANGDMVIERYFIRANSTILACDAGRLSGTDQPSGIKSGAGALSFGNGGGSELMLGVDQFKILLVTEETKDTDGDGKLGRSYLTPTQYKAITTTDKPAITAVKIALLIHGVTPILENTELKTFDILGTSNTLKATVPTNTVRNKYEANVLLRNARVIHFATTSATP